MEFSEHMLKRRIAALLPPRSVDSRGSGNGHRANDPERAQTVDVSDLPAIADDEGFLRQAYHRILGRECDVSGFVNYLELLKRHVPRRVILLQLINSEEGRRRGIRFTGIQELVPPTRRRTSLFSIRAFVGRIGAVLRDLIRRIVFTRFDSIDHKLEFLLREVTAKTDTLAARADESFVSLSEKLDAYVVNLSELNRRGREELAFQGSQAVELRRSVDLSRELLASVGLRTSELARGLAGMELQTSELGRDLAKVESHTGALARDLTSVETHTSTLARQLASQTLRLDQSISLLQADLQALRVRLDAATVALGTTLTAAADEARQGTVAVVEEQRRAIESIRSSAAVNSDAMLASLAEVFGRIRPPVVSAGVDVLATEVAGMIVGVPGNEWRMAAYHAFRGVMEPGMTKYFCSLIKPGAVVVDVGANVGMYTLLAARLLQGKGKIYSFEPTPRTFEILRDNVQVNGFLELGIIHLHQLAVTDRSGKARLSIFHRDSGHNTLFNDGKADNEIEVATTSLDEILATQEHVDIVKIDAEGAEPLILRGMQQVIQRNPEIRIVMEFAPVHLLRAGSSPMQLLDDITSLGFAIHRIDDVNGDLLNVTQQELTEAFSVNLQLELPQRTRKGR
jgi:FkbM family methyltransferase